MTASWQSRLGEDDMRYERKVLDDKEADDIITELYNKGHNMADRIIEEILGPQICREDREDLLQEGFLRMVKHVEDLKERTLAGRLSYMSSAMRNLAIDEGRRLTKCRLLGFCDSIDSEDCQELSSDILTPEEYFLQKETREENNVRLEKAFAQLDTRDQALLREKYGNERNDREIGKLLGIRTENVRTYLHRARKKLAAFYEEA